MNIENNTDLQKPELKDFGLSERDVKILKKYTSWFDWDNYKNGKNNQDRLQIFSMYFFSILGIITVSAFLMEGGMGATNGGIIISIIFGGYFGIILGCIFGATIGYILLMILLILSYFILYKPAIFLTKTILYFSGFNYNAKAVDFQKYNQKVKLYDDNLEQYYKAKRADLASLLYEADNLQFEIANTRHKKTIEELDVLMKHYGSKVTVLSSFLTESYCDGLTKTKIQHHENFIKYYGGIASAYFNLWAGLLIEIHELEVLYRDFENKKVENFGQVFLKYCERCEKVIENFAKLPLQTPNLVHRVNTIKSNIANKENEFFIYLKQIVLQIPALYQQLFRVNQFPANKNELLETYNLLIFQGLGYYEKLQLDSNKNSEVAKNFLLYSWYAKKENFDTFCELLEDVTYFDKLEMRFYRQRFTEFLAKEFIGYAEDVREVKTKFNALKIQNSNLENRINHHITYSENRLYDARNYSPATYTYTRVKTENPVPKPKKKPNRNISKSIKNIIAPKPTKINKENFKNFVPVISKKTNTIISQVNPKEEIISQESLSKTVLENIVSNVFETIKEVDNNTVLTSNNLLLQDIDKIEKKSIRKRTRTFIGKKVDYQAQNQRAKDIGYKGELLVLQYEKNILANILPAYLVNKISHTSALEGDGKGYDIFSYNIEGKPKYIEVKTTTGDLETPFDLTINEIEFMKLHTDNYCLYRVYNYNEETNKGELYVLQGKKAFENYFQLEAKTYTAKLKNKII